MNKTSLLFLPAALWVAVAGCAAPETKPAVPPAAVPVAPAAPPPSAAETVLPDSATNAPAPFEGEGWRVIFDGKSLSGWRPTAFAGRGEVLLESGCVVLNMGDPFTGITWTNAFPKNNYEIAFDAMRVSGADFFCGLTVPVRDSFCSLIVGGWGGSLIGISSLDGMDASENETSKFDSFDSGRWYRIRLRVTTDKLEAWIDADKVVDVVTTGRRISVRAGEIELSEPLGIAAWQTTAAVREIRFRAVDGPASPVKRRRD
jgi:hypothetical protein